MVFQLCYEFNSYRLIPKLYSVNDYNSKPIKKIINMPTTNLQKKKLVYFIHSWFIRSFVRLNWLAVTRSTDEVRTQYCCSSFVAGKILLREILGHCCWCDDNPFVFNLLYQRVYPCSFKFKCLNLRELCDLCFWLWNIFRDVWINFVLPAFN